MTILYLHPISKCLAWPDGLAKNYNGSNQPCDMLVGPCSCGASHYVGEFLGDFEIREFPTNANRVLKVEVLGEASVLAEESNKEFEKRLNLWQLPKPPVKSATLVDFLSAICYSIPRAAEQGKRYVRVSLPQGFNKHAPISDWLAASGYSCTFDHLEITIAW